ncbi:MAG: pyridoxal phosphate-dependent aminotransferase [Gemmatimonadaceae bacterium]
MSQDRRSFIRTLGVGGAGALSLPAWISARGLEAGTHAEPSAVAAASRASGVIKLDSNENPNGPVPAVIREVQRSFRAAALYPARSEQPVRDAIAKANALKSDQIMLGCGSGEVLRLAVQAFCSPSKHLVSALPSFESPAQYARVLGLPVQEIPLDSELRIDLAAMARASRGAGLVFLCNPNNPTGHVHSAAAVKGFIDDVLRTDPEVVVLVDEAYHEFVDDPSYATAVPMIASTPRVFVSRTFSKIYGMAGMRLGYALGAPATLTRMERLRLPNGIGSLTQVAGLAAMSDPAQLAKEQRENRAARAFTTKWFTDAGFAVVPSQTNFILVRLNRDAAAFGAACAKHDVFVGRVFPPLMTHTRISIGTMDEMQRAVQVFKQVLA